MTPIEQLDEQLKAVCPIGGVSIGRWDDSSTWRIDFKDEATRAERRAAMDVLAKFDPASVPAPVDEMEQLKARIAALEAKGS